MCVLTLLAFTLLPTAPLCSRAVTRNAHMPVVMGRKPGVSEPEQIKEFVAKAGANLIVLDARNTDFSVEPGDEATNAKAPIGASSRARAVNAPFDRKANALDVSLIPQEWIDAAGGKEAVPVITHCGGGGRGQKAKDYLESQACRLHTPAHLVGEEIHPRRATHTPRRASHHTAARRASKPASSDPECRLAVGRAGLQERGQWRRSRGRRELGDIWELVAESITSAILN